MEWPLLKGQVGAGQVDYQTRTVAHQSEGGDGSQDESIDADAAGGCGAPSHGPVAVDFVNRQGDKRSRILCAAALKLWWMVLDKGGWIRAHWVPRDLNKQADFLFMTSIESWDFGLKQEVADDLWRWWYRAPARY